MNNTYFEVGLLLVYGHRTNVLSTWSSVSCLWCLLFLFHTVATHSDAVGGCNTDIVI